MYISPTRFSPFGFYGQFRTQQYTLVLHVSHKYKFASTVSSVPTPAFILLIIGCAKIAQKEKDKFTPRLFLQGSSISTASFLLLRTLSLPLR